MTCKSDSDCFKFDCSFTNENEEKITRRRILSIYSRIFDPLGSIQPFSLKPKLIIQELSRLKLLWDDEILDSIKNDWRVWLSEITGISKFEFPRCIVKNNNFISAEMHIFPDSSHEVYSVSVYGRFTYNNSKIDVVFLFGKCKVCPVGDTFPIPRLELVAAAMATRISKSIVLDSNIDFECTIY